MKGALFIVAGILLAKLSSADEIALYGRGRALWPAGIAMAVGGLLLGGAPMGRLMRPRILRRRRPRRG